MSRELRALGYRKLSARPRHHAQAAGAIEDFKKTCRRPRPACGGRNGVAILIAGGERPRNFWWWVTPSKNVAHGLLRT
jgi:Winged helix-turn helix